MKKIINGRVYDTAIAKLLGSYSHGAGGDMEAWEEALYIKRTGEYFLHGQGGAMSRYAASCGLNEWGWGERIMPMGYAKARAWAEQHLSADQYTAAFGVPDEEDVEVLHVQMPSAMMATIRARASEAGQSLKDYVIEALAKGIK